MYILFVHLLTCFAGSFFAEAGNDVGGRGMYDTKEIGKRIRLLRKNHNMTQRELTKILHLSDTGAVSKMENGKLPVSMNIVIEVADIFGVSIKYVLLGERFY